MPTVIMCFTTVLGAVLGPASVYGVKLLIDGATGQGSMLLGVIFTGGALLISTMASKFAGPIGDTLDEQVALVERDAHQLGGIYRLLGTLGVISGTATVIVMLWSVSPLIRPLLLRALVPG